VDDFRHEMKKLWQEQHQQDADIELSATLKIFDNVGGEHVGKVIGLNVNRDLCILTVQNTNLPVSILADDYPMRGDRIFNLAAPMGIWEVGTTHRFDGYYAGPTACDPIDIQTYHCIEGEKLWSSFSLAAATGSSGSPIYNWNGELIGIVVKVTRDFSHIVYAVRLEDIKLLLNEVLEFETTPNGMMWNPDFDTPDSISGATIR
jgi:S1-C subfamily serine protease